jgi:hypothetical protein
LTPSSNSWRRWGWFVALWAGSVLALTLVGGVLKLFFSAILS